jgi:hypothetical protein
MAARQLTKSKAGELPESIANLTPTDCFCCVNLPFRMATYFEAVRALCDGAGSGQGNSSQSRSRSQAPRTGHQHQDCGSLRAKFFDFEDHELCERRPPGLVYREPWERTIQLQSLGLQSERTRPNGQPASSTRADAKRRVPPFDQAGPASAAIAAISYCL